ncbi:MAG: acetate kinase, partial [Clostridia bacterium]|nr:acetate kinase [Clostridia bacterium]
MKILVINAGSSSLKYQLMDSESGYVIAKGLCERIGIDGAMTYKPTGREPVQFNDTLKDHTDAIKLVINTLTNPDIGVVKSMDEIDAVGHRLVHGGEKFAKSVLITEEVIQTVESLNSLAPLHNPANLMGVRACMEIMPDVPMVAVFDTAFHQTMPKKAYVYPVPYEYSEKYSIRKYGFHGTSH